MRLARYQQASLLMGGGGYRAWASGFRVCGVQRAQLACYQQASLLMGGGVCVCVWRGGGGLVVQGSLVCRVQWLWFVAHYQQGFTKMNIHLQTPVYLPAYPENVFPKKWDKFWRGRGRVKSAERAVSE